MESPPPEKELYHGNCHCGALKFSVALAPPTKAVLCNCSICTRKGHLFAVPELPSDFKILTGENAIKTYKFHTIDHKFCSTCGTAVFAHLLPYDRILVNLRTFKHNLVDVDALEMKAVDFASKEPHYQPFVPSPEQTPEVPEGMRLYTGSCHCQAVKYTVVCPEITQVRTCNCSFCSRNADMWIYPPATSVNIMDTETALTEYRFGNKQRRHGFCGICGVDMFIEMHDVRQVNVRTMNGMDLEALKLDKVDGRNQLEGNYAPDEE